MDLKERSENPHRHPWELSRADMVLDMVRGNPRSTRYADIGSGDLYFAGRLASLTDAAVYAVDVNYGTPGTDGPIRICTDLNQLGPESVDSAVLMDVLEHVGDDVGLVAETRRVLAPSGQVLVTVPAHAFLWSEHDVFLEHHRRYDRDGLRAALNRGGLDVIEMFYFYALPFAARAVMVALGRIGLPGSNAGAVGRWRYAVHHPVTRAARAALNADFRLSRLLGDSVVSGCGLSICAICRRTSA
jgi:SAM-dependent methyltransferase